MYDLYVFRTPNSWKTTIMAEELGEPYECHTVNFGKGENRSPAFLAISPLGKVPVVVDRDDKQTVYGSATVLIYLAEKYGRFLPTSGPARTETLEWTMFALTDFGNAFNIWSRFDTRLQPRDDFAVDHFWGEASRFCQFADDRLGEHEFLAGDSISIADMAAIPFVGGERREDRVLDPYPNLKRWVDQMEARPAVQRGFALPKLDG